MKPKILFIWISCLLLVAMVSLLPQDVQARDFFDAGLIHDRFCLSGRQAASVAQHLSPTIKNRMRLPQPGTTAQISENAPAIACITSPAHERVALGSAIPTTLALALSDVETHQVHHGTPRGLTFFNGNASVVVYRYDNAYAIVSISNIPLHPTTLGCNHELSLRITIQTGNVVPFDGCVEVHKHILPSFSQLPPI